LGKLFLEIGGFEMASNLGVFFQNGLTELGKTLSLMRNLESDILEISENIAKVLRGGGVVYAFGNGGSAASANHFVAEFVGKLKVDRRPSPAISLNTEVSTLTAIANDYGYEEVFARQVSAHVTPEDLVLGISTSGKSKSILLGLEAAAGIGANTYLLTGKGKSSKNTIRVPHSDTARIQEAHDFLLHSVAQLAERMLHPELDNDASADAFDFVLQVEDFSEFKNWVRGTGIILGTTNGVFDLLHGGHLAALRAASLECDRLVVFLNDDDSVHLNKGPSRPVRSQNERVQDLKATSFVSHVVLMSEQNAATLIEQLEPNFHFKGDEYQGFGIPEETAIKKVGGQMKFHPRTPNVSTSRDIERTEL
jgi:D-sedoheptulose 7-phosphate isomerase